MNTDLLLNIINTNDLIHEAPDLMAWEIGAVNNVDDVAQFMCQGGPDIRAAAIKRPPSIESEHDTRPPKKYWDFVREEFKIFLCSQDRRYKELWKRLGRLENKSTAALVVTISAYMGNKVGVEIGVISGFVAVCLYGALKIGKEALCRYLTSKDA